MLFIGLLSLSLLAGCGIKPKELTPPDADSATPSTFPRVYPDPTL